MSALQCAIKAAYDAAGNSKEANKAYLEFIKANFILPIEQRGKDESPEVLFLQDGDNFFLPAFTDKVFLDLWAAPIQTEISLLTVSGVDLLTGIGDNTAVCLDIGSPHYKQFLPEEIARMRSMVLKLFKAG